MPWESSYADGSRWTATRRGARGLALALILGLGAAEAQSEALSEARPPDPLQVQVPGAPPPYAREVFDLTGLPVTVRHVRCRSGSAPDTWADVFLVRQGRQYRIGRVTYDEGVRAVLDQGQTFPVTRRAYERYVLGGEPFSEFGMNALLGLWRALGMRFRLGAAESTCRVD